jgi:2-phospho-L-lactate guanylyltransferase (CobY/MobA/RfbA family)
MPTFVVPYRPDGKSRLGDPEMAHAMFQDVCAACAPLGYVLVCDRPGGQREGVAETLAEMIGPVVIVNSDVPCVTTEELAQLEAAAPALVAARDGTTNALALRDAREFLPLYGPGSATLFQEVLGAERLVLSGLRDDVDTAKDLRRVAPRVGPFTRRLLEARAAA